MSKIIKLPQAKPTGLTERKLLRAMIDQVPDYLFVKDLKCRFVVANEAVARIHGFDSVDEVIGITDFDLHDAVSAGKFFQIERSVMQSGHSIVDMEELVVDAVTGKEKWLLTTKVAMRDNVNIVVGLVGISRDITARKKEDLLRDEQAVVVEMIALNSPLEVILDRPVRLIESQLEGVYGSILLLDETGTYLTHGAAPSLPKAYCQATDGIAVGPAVGSCGTAAYRRESVIVADIANDPLWTDFRDLAALHGLRSCWSTPILSHQRNVLGTFAMYSAEVRSPTEIETSLTKVTTRTAAIASVPS